jgi:hypothetical protein
MAKVAKDTMQRMATKEKLVPSDLGPATDKKAKLTPEKILAATKKMKSPEELVEAVNCGSLAGLADDDQPQYILEPEYLPRIEIVYDRVDRKQPYKVTFYNSETRSVFQKMIVFTFQKALMVFRRNLIMEGEENGGK